GHEHHVEFKVRGLEREVPHLASGIVGTGVVALEGEHRKLPAHTEPGPEVVLKTDANGRFSVDEVTRIFQVAEIRRSAEAAVEDQRSLLASVGIKRLGP